MICSFFDDTLEFSIEQQTKDYILTIIQSGGVTTQNNQLTILTSPDQAEIFRLNRCSDIEEIVPNFTTGNRDFYIFDDVFIIIYKVYNG